MKAYFFALLSALGVIFIFNSRVDVRGARAVDETYQLALRQKPGEVMERHDIFDQRVWVKANLLGKRVCPETLVLGSSTIGILSQEMFSGRPFLNAWLTGPTWQDFRAITAMLEDADCKPKEIILGLDAWMLEDKEDNSRWATVSDWNSRYVRKHDSWPEATKAEASSVRETWSALADLISFQTTKESLKQWKSRLSASPSAPTGPNAVANIDDDQIRIFPGLDEYCRIAQSLSFVRGSDGTTKQCSRFEYGVAQATALGKAYVPAMGTEGLWHSPQSERLAQLAELISVWKGMGAKVLVLAPPYNPYSYEDFQKSPELSKYLAEFDRELLALAEPGVSYLNLRDPGSVGCGIADFKDAHHYKQDCALRILNRIKGTETSWNQSKAEWRKYSKRSLIAKFRFHES